MIRASILTTVVVCLCVYVCVFGRNVFSPNLYRCGEEGASLASCFGKDVSQI